MKREKGERTSRATIKDLVEVLGDELSKSIEELREELVLLRATVDELVVEAQWANRNSEERHPPRELLRPITSMPLDPCADDWAERLNQFSARDLPADAHIQHRGHSAAKRDRLF